MSFRKQDEDFLQISYIRVGEIFCTGIVNLTLISKSPHARKREEAAHISQNKQDAVSVNLNPNVKVTGRLQMIDKILDVGHVRSTTGAFWFYVLSVVLLVGISTTFKP